MVSGAYVLVGATILGAIQSSLAQGDLSKETPRPKLEVAWKASGLNLTEDRNGLTANFTGQGQSRTPLSIPWNINARCRRCWVGRNGDDAQLFRVFVATDPDNSAEWCELMKQHARHNCGKNGGKPLKDVDDVAWEGCIKETTDSSWERGAMATLVFGKWNDNVDDCVADAAVQALGGARVDWLAGFGCYEDYCSDKLING